MRPAFAHGTMVERLLSLLQNSYFLLAVLIYESFAVAWVPIKKILKKRVISALSHDSLRWSRITEGARDGLDQNHPQTVSPRWVALCKRYDG